MARRTATFLTSAIALAGCSSTQPTPPGGQPGQPQTEDDLVLEGERIFFFETFDGNGRTCGTCHRAERNFLIDAAFIATLPPDDPLFVAEVQPALRENFEKPALLRAMALILENQDGFDDLENNFNLRGVPHTLALRTSIQSINGPRTGWSGDGSPGDGSLRSFAVGAVIQHFTRTLDRVADVDFRLPTDPELDALEAFLLSLGRQQDLVLPLPLTGAVARRGQSIFLDDTLGKCNLCHHNAGANAVLAGSSLGNANFNIGVADLPDKPQDLLGELLGQFIPEDDGFGTPGDGTFNTPPLVEAADTGPFFHNGSVETIEGAVSFYSGEAFNNSPAGQTLASIDSDGFGIQLDATQTVAVAAFLRVINTLENIRQSLELLDALLGRRVPNNLIETRLVCTLAETGDAIRVLEGGGLHPEAVIHLRAAEGHIERAVDGAFERRRNMGMATPELRAAWRQLTEEDAP